MRKADFRKTSGISYLLSALRAHLSQLPETKQH